MKIEEILFKQFPNMPTLGEFLDWVMIQNEYVKKDKMYLTWSMKFILLRGFRKETKQQLQLKQLVPCNKKGEVLEGYYKDGVLHYDGISPEELSESEKDVLFEGFDNICISQLNTFCYDKISELVGEKVTINFWKKIVK